MNKRCLNPGSGLDFKSIAKLPFINEWIFVDTGPNSDGDLKNNATYSVTSYLDKDYDSDSDDDVDIKTKTKLFFERTMEQSSKYGFLIL